MYCSGVTGVKISKGLKAPVIGVKQVGQNHQYTEKEEETGLKAVIQRKLILPTFPLKQVFGEAPM